MVTTELTLKFPVVGQATEKNRFIPGMLRGKHGIYAVALHTDGLSHYWASAKLHDRDSIASSIRMLISMLKLYRA